MTQIKNTLIAGLAALATTVISSSALAGIGGTDSRPVIRGERAPAVPLSVNTGPNDSSPFAFADFPDLPGYLPPETEDRSDETEEVYFGGGIDNGAINFGGPKLPPPTTEQTFGDPFPDWGHGISTPFVPRAGSPLDDDIVAVDRFPAAPASVPAPGAAVLLMAGAAAARRRRR
ncbi:MAG: hypothetical protein H6812_06970 [Phycisphaeraceae bacterium]|nr:hypothetical protein [Phycisphaerales bacterium]MCB9842983.1 hypothetical protein [Phycisphaeraceae bacterium]